MKGVARSWRFLWKLLLFIGKRFYNLWYNAVCSFISFKGSLKEDHKFKSLSCRIRNNMEIYSPCKWLGFINKENEEQGCLKEKWMLPFVASRLSLWKITKAFIHAEGSKLCWRSQFWDLGLKRVTRNAKTTLLTTNKIHGSKSKVAISF